MSRKLSLLFFAASVAVITACSSVAGPNRDDPPEGEPIDSSEFCEGVVVGSHTRCATDTTGT